MGEISDPFLCHKRRKDKQLLPACEALQPVSSPFVRVSAPQHAHGTGDSVSRSQARGGHTDAGVLAPGPECAATYLQLQPESTVEPGSGLGVQHRMESWVYLLFS